MNNHVVERIAMRFRWLPIVVVFVVMIFALNACGGGAGDAAEEARKKAEAKLAELKIKSENEGDVAAKTTEIKMPSAQEVLDEVGVTYQYDPINKPDPFRPYSPAAELIVGGGSDNPLLKFEVRYFKLVGIIKDTESPLAIFEDPSGKSYTVHVSDAIGKNGGIVRSILEDAVVVTETRISWRTEGTETVEIIIRLRPEDKA